MKYLILIIVILSAQLSSAQTTKSLSLGADGSRGNFSSVGVTLKADLKKDAGKYQYAWVSTYRWSEQSAYGKNTLNLYENELYGTGSITKQLGKWKLMAFTEDEKSYLRKIRLRGSLGLGLGHSIIKARGFDVVISEVILPEYYWSSESVSKNNFTVRASTRFKFEYVKGIFKTSSVTLFQPAVFSTRDVSFNDNLNLRSTNSISFKLNTVIELGVLYTISYQGYPHYLNKAVSPSQETASLMVKCNF